MPTVQVKVQVGLWVPKSSPVKHGKAFCGLLVLRQEDLPALARSTQVVYRCPSAGSLGRCDCASGS